MGCRIIEGSDYSALYCSTTMRAFGPVMPNHLAAETFLKWLPGDARHYSEKELGERYNEFVMLFVCECGEVRYADCQECKDGVPLVAGVHRQDDGETSSCDNDPAPSKGERFTCRYCVEAEKRKAKGMRR